MDSVNILYIRGMGGGGDRRIPGILRDNEAAFSPEGVRARVIVRTYSFDPEVAAGQIAAWMEELKPVLVVGESLGSIHAIRLRGVPHLFVSPSLGAPTIFGRMAPLASIPGVTAFLDRFYRPRPGDRQPLHFSKDVLLKYTAHLEAALDNSPSRGGKDFFHAFFGRRDHYRKYGVVSIRKWRKYFGDNSFTMYDGTHFMEEGYVVSLLVPKIREILINLQFKDFQQ